MLTTDKLCQNDTDALAKWTSMFVPPFHKLTIKVDNLELDRINGINTFNVVSLPYLGRLSLSV